MGPCRFLSTSMICSCFCCHTCYDYQIAFCKKKKKGEKKRFFLLFVNHQLLQKPNINVKYSQPCIQWLSWRKTNKNRIQQINNFLRFASNARKIT